MYGCLLKNLQYVIVVNKDIMVGIVILYLYIGHRERFKEI